MSSLTNDDLSTCIQEIITPYADGTILTPVNTNEIIEVNLYIGEYEKYKFYSQNRSGCWNIIISNKYPDSITFGIQKDADNSNLILELNISKVYMKKALQAFIELNFKPYFEGSDRDLFVSIYCEPVLPFIFVELFPLDMKITNKSKQEIKENIWSEAIEKVCKIFENIETLKALPIKVSKS
jgi:hypothetical protein